MGTDGGTRHREGRSFTGWVIKAIFKKDGNETVRILAQGGTYFVGSFSSFTIEAYAMCEAMDVLHEFL